nr:PASTA domain-containing protein [Clostridia bacterium]
MLKSNLSLTKVITRRRSGVLFLVFLLLGAFLVVNIFRLDFFLYGYYSDKTLDQITTTSTLKAERGKIYGANMTVLATTETTWRVFISTRDLRKNIKKDGVAYDEIIADGISGIYDLDREKLLNKIRAASMLDLTLIKEATEEQYEKTLDFIEENGLERLLLLEAQSSRYYPQGTLAAHVLGFTGSDEQGLFGLEYSYNSTLTGKDGYYMYARDANGNALPGEYTDYVEAEDGYSIVTTIDEFVQTALESQLEKIRVNHDVSNRVTGIVMDTKTGAILGMATSSPFDPNSPFVLDSVSQNKLDSLAYPEDSEEYKAEKASLMQTMWSNKAIGEIYEPGSTFKIVTVAAALDSGAAKITDTFSCSGYLNVGGWRIKCHKVKGHGSGFSLAYGLQMSCNPTMMQIAERVGASTFYEYVDAFGYFEKTGIDLPGEALGIFHEKENIGSTELATASFGQRFKVSVIQQLTAVAAVANGGYLVTPYVVDRIIDSEGAVVERHESVPRRRVISEEVAKTIATALEEGVSGEGGAKNAYVEGYLVAAKTGTSEKFDVLDENGKSYLRIASTVAFAPSSEAGIAVIIVVDEPQSQVKYGSVVAAPYVSALLSEVLPYLDYKSSAQSSEYTTESYVGMNISSAKNLLDGRKVSYKVIGDGSVVLAQTPAEGVEITPALSTVYLYTTKETENTAVVPNLIGMTLADANKALINSGLNVYIEMGTENRGEILTVTRQDYPEGTVLPVGTVVKIYAIATDFED